MPSFYGKYRGKVKNNLDPMNLGRIQVEVPAVLGAARSSWAMPCVPYGGAGVGFFALPPVNANVWVEFEGGNPEYPIWVGCFWGEGEMPVEPAIPMTKVLKTDAITLTLADEGEPPGFTLEVGPPAVPEPLKLTMTPSGIELSNSNVTQVKLTAESVEAAFGETASVTINEQGITLDAQPLQVRLVQEEGLVEISSGPARVRVLAEEMELNLNQNSLKLAPAGVMVSVPPATVNVEAASINLQNGLGDVAISSAGVNINQGALEVT